jgi:hypothetical protein
MEEMNVRITTCNAAWGPERPVGVTKYEIEVDGVIVATAGPRATAARIGLKEGQTDIEVFALGIGGERIASGKVSWAN